MAVLRQVLRTIQRGELRSLLRDAGVAYQVVVNADNGPSDTDNPFTWFVTQTS